MIAHDVLTFVSAGSLNFPDIKVKVTPYSYESSDTDQYNPSCALEMREGMRPTVNSSNEYFDENEYYTDMVRYNEPQNGEVSALQVLSLYSAEPDWGMDTELKISPIQQLTGGSQGYRHMRYGLFFFRAGRAHTRAVYFQRLARKAFDLKDCYWGIRFSARALHYVEDILSPFHTKPFPELFLLRKLFRGRELYFTTYNYHLNFERFIGYKLWHGDARVTGCIEKGEPSEISDLKKDLLKASRRVRRLLSPIFRECRKLWGDTMSQELIKLRRETVKSINPPRRFQTLVCSWLCFETSFVKGYIKKYILPYIEGTEK